jgi:hypothetical protein
MTAALIKDLFHGLMADFSDTEFPCRVYGIAGVSLEIAGAGNLYGFAWDGGLSIQAGGVTHSVPEGSYFSVAGTGFRIMGGYGYKPAHAV